MCVCVSSCLKQVRICDLAVLRRLRQNDLEFMAVLRGHSGTPFLFIFYRYSLTTSLIIYISFYLFKLYTLVVFLVYLPSYAVVILILRFCPYRNNHGPPKHSLSPLAVLLLPPGLLTTDILTHGEFAYSRRILWLQSYAVGSFVIDFFQLLCFGASSFFCVVSDLYSFPSVAHTGYSLSSPSTKERSCCFHPLATMNAQNPLQTHIYIHPGHIPGGQATGSCVNTCLSF